MHSINIIAKMQDYLSEDSNIMVAYLGGSHARQLNDQLSDIDICLICHRVLSLEERRVFYLSLGVDRVLNLDESSTRSVSGVSDSVLVDGVKMDINAIEFSLIKDLVHNYELVDCLSPHLSELFFALNEAEPFKGRGILDELRAFICGPTAVHLNNAVSQYLQLESRVDSLEKALTREDYLQLNKLLIIMYERLYFTLTTVSGRYFPGYKRSQHYALKFNLHSFMPGIEVFWKLSDVERVRFIKSTFSHDLFKGLENRGA